MDGRAPSTLLAFLPSDLLLLAEQPGIALQVLYSMAAVGARIHVIGGPRAKHLRLSRLVASFTLVDLPPEDGDLDELRATLEAVAYRTGASMILPGDEYSTRVVVRLAPELTTRVFPCPSEATFWSLADKMKFYELCRRIGAPVPETLWIGVKDRSRLLKAGQALGYPLVVKPVDQGNGNGVVILRTEAQLFDKVIDDPDYDYENLIAQAFIPGVDIDCSVLAVAGKAIAVAVQRRIDRAVVFLPDAALVGAVETVLAATGYTGVAHFDARLDERDGSIQLIECNPRFWASMEAARRCGLNFVEVGLRAATGQRFEPQALDCGRFQSWTSILRSATKLDLRFLGSAPSLRALFLTVTDPLPVLAEVVHAIRRRRRSPVLRAQPVHA